MLIREARTGRISSSDHKTKKKLENDLHHSTDQKRHVFIVGSGCLYMPMHSVIPLNAVPVTGKVMRHSDTAKRHEYRHSKPSLHIRRRSGQCRGGLLCSYLRLLLSTLIKGLTESPSLWLPFTARTTRRTSETSIKVGQFTPFDSSRLHVHYVLHAYSANRSRCQFECLYETPREERSFQ